MPAAPAFAYPVEDDAFSRPLGLSAKNEHEEHGEGGFHPSSPMA